MSPGARLGAVCALTLCLASSSAYAVPTVEDKESARNLFRMGDERFQARDFTGALAHFKAADAIMGLPTTGLEVGRTLAKLGKLIEAREKLRAVASLESEVGELQAQVDARAEAKALFLGLADKIPTLMVRLTARDGGKPRDLVVTINGEEMVEEAALSPRKVNPGRHRLTVKARGYQTETRNVTVVEAQNQVLDIELVARPPELDEERPATTEPSSPADPALATTLGVVSLSLGGVGLVVGGVTGILTLVEADDLAARCPNKTCAPVDESLMDRTLTLSHVSTGTLIGGGVLALAGVVTLAVALGGSGESELAWRSLVGPGYLGVETVW